ncbi:MAG: protein kinase [Anaerolineales bacterium]
MTDLIGKSVGRYHILEQLGEGGMASVYKAFDTRLEREVALKIILPTRQQSTKFLKRFEREAKALAQLSHASIVKIHDYGEHEGLPFLVMEYLPSGTLKDRLGEPMPWPEAARNLAPIARALQYAHGRKIVHRDVKPSNILITESGEPMLSDFGIAKVLEAEETWDLTGTGVGVGTPEYMAPEQGMGKPVDHRADIYALGIVFYEMVTGRTPFRADTPLATLLKQVHDPLPRPKELVPQLPSSVEQVIIKALAKKPEDRFQEIGAFALALEELTRGEKLGIAELPSVALPNLRRRLSSYSTLAVIVVVAAAIVAALALFLRRDLPAAEPDPTLALALATDIAETALAGQGATATQKALENRLTSTQLAADRNLTATIVALTPTASPTTTPTVTPKPYVDGAILFEDDFEDGDANDWMIGTLGWEVLQDETGNHFLRGAMEPDPESDMSLQIGAGSTSWQDYAFEFRARIVQGERESLNARIRFNDQLDSGCRAYRLIIEGGSVHLYRVGYGDPVCEVLLGRTRTSLSDGEWHLVRMEAFRSIVSVYVDGERTFYVDDPDPVERGRIEITIRQGSMVDLDDVRVVELLSMD